APAYQRPGFGGDDRFFDDLVAQAPGMNTTRTDVLGTIDLEAVPDPANAPGTVEAAAVQLIERARACGWRRLSLPAADRYPAFHVTFDGQGRYVYERVLPEGLREQVVCDGTTLWHLYPDLSIGARRTVSRFHRAEFTGRVPWALPTVEDLARGANLQVVGKHTVRVSPRDAGTEKPFVCVDLLFAPEGRLAERRVLEMPAGKTLSRETYSA